MWRAAKMSWRRMTGSAAVIIMLMKLSFISLGPMRTMEVQAFSPLGPESVRVKTIKLLSTASWPPSCRDGKGSSCPSLGARGGDTTRRRTRNHRDRTLTCRGAAPRPLPENAPGVLYVNDRCIDCAACSGLAPQTFGPNAQETAHVVHHQPTTDQEVDQARAALAACPVAAIRLRAPPLEMEGERSEETALLRRRLSMGQDKPFPRPLAHDHTMGEVYWLGHHNEKSFGAIPYLVQARYQGRLVWIMVDTPKFTRSAVEAVQSLTTAHGGRPGPDYLVLTHVDDTADHNLWVQYFRENDQQQQHQHCLKRIFHSGDLGRHNWLGDRTLEQVEVLLQPPPPPPTWTPAGEDTPLTAYNLNGDILPADWYHHQQQQQGHDDDDPAAVVDDDDDEVVLLHTPGHSPGSITLYRRPRPASESSPARPGILFTGDTYAYTPTLSPPASRGGRSGHMSAFPRYSNNATQLARTLHRLHQLDWEVVAPGHGHYRDYRRYASSSTEELRRVQQQELQVALEELKSYHNDRRW